MEHLKKYLLLYVLLPLVVLMVATSYYRFMVVQDYTIGYEGDCDPYTESCYVYCEEWDDDSESNDDECSDPFYYSWIERHAGMIYDECGALVTECDAAYECANGDDSCAIYFCDTEFEECDELTGSDIPLEIMEADEGIETGSEEVLEELIQAGV